jgi:hypothetical protein
MFLVLIITQSYGNNAAAPMPAPHPALPHPRRASFAPAPVVVESLQRIADWCLQYMRDESRRGGLPPIPSGRSLPGEVPWSRVRARVRV